MKKRNVICAALLAGAMAVSAMSMGFAAWQTNITGSGTASANLADAVIELNTESDQLVLDKPDLSEEVLQPGESCTITFVVKVPEDITGDLDAAGTLTVTLPCSQAAVEAAPAAGHTHG